MSAENVQAAIDALNTVLEDVKVQVGQETAAQKIAFLGYETRTRNLIDSLGFLVEGFFSEIEEPVDEEENETPER
jgi:hypothetical protein